jgi:hypothetical protein
MTTQEATVQIVGHIVTGVVIIFILLAVTDNLDIFKQNKK